MRTLTVTFHHGNNYGALFQMFALHSKIKHMGHDNLVLETAPSTLKKEKKVVRNPKAILRDAYIFCFQIFRHKKMSSLTESFSEFKRRNVAFTPAYSSMEDLKSNCPYVDALITGSDQVWNLNTVPSMIPSRFLDFGNPNAIRFSFAASIESMDYSDSQKEFVREKLRTFKGISLREKSACDYIESFTDYHTECMLDPVFLFDKAEWTSFSKKPRIKGPYILCYQVISNRLMQKVVDDLKKETGYPIVAICNVPFKWIHADYSLFDVSPEEFLGLYNNASCVVTTSFHGTAFGILFNKRTYTITRDISSNRIFNLMRLFGLEDFVIRPNAHLTNKAIDWNSVNGVISKERKRSTQYLQNMLSK